MRSIPWQSNPRLLQRRQVEYLRQLTSAQRASLRARWQRDTAADALVASAGPGPRERLGDLDERVRSSLAKSDHVSARLLLDERDRVRREVVRDQLVRRVAGARSGRPPTSPDAAGAPLATDQPGAARETATEAPPVPAWPAPRMIRL